MKKFASLIKKIDSFGFLLAAITLVLLSFLTFLQVIMRYVIEKPIAWADEMTRYLFVWLSFLGTCLAAKKKSHVAVLGIINLFPKKPREILYMISQVTTLIIVTVILYSSYIGIKPLKNQLSAAMQVPMLIPYLVIPFSFLVYWLILAHDIMVELRTPAVKEDKSL